MGFSIKVLDWTKAGAPAIKNGCFMIGLSKSQILASATKMLGVAIRGLVARFTKLGDFEGKRGTSLLLHEMAGMGAARMLLVGLDKEASFTDCTYTEAVRTVLRALASTKAASVTWTLTEYTARDKDAAWAVSTAVMLIHEASYHSIKRHPELRSKRDKNGTGLRELVLAVPAADAKAASMTIVRGTVITNDMDLTRDLGNLSSNIYTSTRLANTTHQIAKDFKPKVEVLGRKQIGALKMDAFLTVTKGGVEPSAFTVLRYEGSPAKQAPVMLVDKGIASSTGGVSLKPDGGMDEMKYDICGAASMLGTSRVVAEMGLKQNIIAVVPACENMPSGVTIKLGDVVTSMLGQAIEILSTDTEGRLILYDALIYVERFKPAVMIDVAMPTGVCIITLNHINTGIYTRNDALADALAAVSKQSLDTERRMPLDEEYQEQLKSNFADMGNIGGRPAGSAMAACFLVRSTKKYNWAHLNTAGTAWKSDAVRGTTDRLVPLLTYFLMDRG